MANSYLQNKQYKIPKDVLESIKSVLISHPQGQGVKRAKFILNNGSLSYESMKRIKHDLESSINDKVQYALAGGNLMKSFIDRMLNSDRSAVKREKEIKQPVNTNITQAVHAYAPAAPTLNEIKKKDKTHNAIAIIVNGDKKILLLKRGTVENGWANGKWGLVGGELKKKEKPEVGCSREIEEETGLVLSKFIKRFTIERGDNIEHIYVTKYDGDGLNIKLDDENVKSGWYGIEEMKFLPTVPNLMDYINIAFKEYE